MLPESFRACLGALEYGRRAGDLVQIGLEIVDRPAQLEERAKGRMSVIYFRVLRIVQAKRFDPVRRCGPLGQAIDAMDHRHKDEVLVA